MAYTYTDAYLSPLVTADRTARAESDVDAIGAFATEWRDKLVVLRSYILICLDSQKSAEDPFAVKLSAYRKEWEATLAQAKAATVGADGLPLTRFSVPLERA
jgi:hypothetical protein